MSCTHDHDALLASVDEALPEAEQRVLDAQLQSCAHCRQVLAQAQAFGSFLRVADPAIDPTAAFDRTVKQAVHNERATARQPWLAWARRPLVWASAVSGCAALVLALTLFSRDPNMNEDDYFVAEHQEMLADLDLIQDMDAVEDFAVIAELSALKQD